MEWLTTLMLASAAGERLAVVPCDIVIPVKDHLFGGNSSPAASKVPSAGFGRRGCGPHSLPQGAAETSNRPRGAKGNRENVGHRTRHGLPLPLGVGYDGVTNA